MRAGGQRDCRPHAQYRRSLGGRRSVGHLGIFEFRSNLAGTGHGWPDDGGMSRNGTYAQLSVPRVVADAVHAECSRQARRPAEVLADWLARTFPDYVHDRMVEDLAHPASRTVLDAIARRAPAALPARSQPDWVVDEVSPKETRT